MVDTVRDIRTRFIGQNMMGSAARGARRDVRSIGDEYSSLRNKISTVNQLIGGITLGIGGSSAARTLANLQNNTARLSTLTATLAKDQQFLSSTSRNLSTDIEAATNAFAKFKVLEEQGALASGESEQLMIGLGNAYARFGVLAGQQENIIYGLAQALGQGQLQAQELNQVVEPAPGLLNAIGRAAGKTGIAYRNLVKDGKITSEMFKKDLLGALKTFDGSAAALAGNIQQTLTRLSNSYKETLLDLNEPITAGVASVAGALTTALEAVGDNAELTATAMKTVGAAILVAYGSRGLRAVQGFSSGYVASATTQIAMIKKVEEAYKRNAIETVAANARIKASNLATIKSEASSTLGTADTAREAALRAAAKKTEAAAQAQITLAKRADTLEEKKRTEALRASEAATKATAAAAAKEQASFTKYHAESTKSAQLRTAAQAQLAGQMKILSKAESESVAANAKLVTARKAVTAAETKYGAQSERVAAALAKKKLATEQLALAERNRLNATIAMTSASQASRAATDGATAATLRASVATAAMNVRLNASIIASRAAAASVSLLKGAYAFIGGGAGVALAAAYGIYKVYDALTDQGPAVEDAKTQIDALQRSYLSLTGEAKKAAEELTAFEKLQRQVRENSTTDAPSLYSKEDIGLFERYLRMSKTGTAILDAQKNTKLESAKATIEELKAAELLAFRNREAGFAAEYTAEQTAKAARAALDARTAAEELAVKFGKSGQKANVVREAIEKMRDALKSAGNDKDLANTLRLGIAGAQEELNTILKVNEARDKQIKLADDLRKKLAEVSASYDTEAEKIGRSFADKELTIRLNFETVDPTTDKTLISQATRDKLLVQNAEAREIAITELMDEQSDKRTQEYEAAAKKQIQINEKIYQDAVNKANELAGAQGRAGDVQGAQDLLLNIERERLERQFGLGETYRVLEKDARIQSERTIQEELARIEEEAYQARLKTRNADSIDKGAGIFTKFAEAAQTDVRSYITLLDNMTDAEKARATESNRIGKREFDRNKVYRKASALVDTFAGANRALAQGGIWGVGEAAAIVALGLRNVANINKQQYGSASSGSSGGSVGSGSSSSSSSDSVDNSAGTASSSNVFIVSMPGETTEQTISRYNDFLPQLAQAARTRNVTISSDKLSVSDTALLRVG